LRDILDEPSVIRHAWKGLNAYAYLSCYDSILVYGCSEIHDSTGAYELLPHARRVVYCNYVSPDQADEPSHPPPEEAFLLMMGGGGSDAYTLALAFVEAFPQLYDRLGMKAFVLTGPNMGTAERDELVRRSPPPLEVLSSHESAHSWIENASAVITLGGYNSLCEVMKWHKKALVVPRPGPSAEQQTRSRLFAARGLARMLHPTDLTAESLTKEVIALMQDPGTPNLAHIPPLDGAERAADAILNGAEHQDTALAILEGNGVVTDQFEDASTLDVDGNGRRDAAISVPHRNP
jgi:predicted glycosyltransferase